MNGMIPITGYEHFAVAGANVLVARLVAPLVRQILEKETLYAYASNVHEALVLQGRAPVYAVPFGGTNGRVAVRHVMRGGWAGHLMRDQFFPPTRVARELAAAFRLRLGGVPTPEVLAVVTYPAGKLLRRADVMTRFVEGGADLSAVFADRRNDAQRKPILDAVAVLIARLTACGAQHPDLNLKNVLVTAGTDGYIAYVLDVDRVHFHVAGDPLVARANIDRLVRSLRQWRTRGENHRELGLSDEDINYLSLQVAALPA